MITLFYFLLYILSGCNTMGAPVPMTDLIIRDGPLNTDSCNNQTKRTLFGIVWSCVSTIILCAWTAVHPNVPPRSKWKARWNRLNLMFWMIVAPELVLAWAVRQFFAAREIRDAYNRRRPGLPEWQKWSLVQGHLVEMGGIVLVDPEEENKAPYEQDGKVLTLDELERLLEDPNFRFPVMTSEDIQDRSKGDALWKIIAILHTTWFILQCIARGQQRLAVSELELVTLALASFNAVTFAIWWYKPLGVQAPVRIYMKMGAQKEEVAAQNEDSQLLICGSVISNYWTIVQLAATVTLKFLLNPCKYGLMRALFALFIGVPVVVSYFITFPISVLFSSAIVLLLRFIDPKPVPRQTPQRRGLFAAQIVFLLQELSNSLRSTTNMFVGRLMFIAQAVIRSQQPNLEPTTEETTFSIGPTTPSDLSSVFQSRLSLFLPLIFLTPFLVLLFLAPFLILLFLVSFIFTTVFGIMTTSTIHPSASHVPSFYAPNTKSDHWSRMVVFAFFGVIFGGLHCIGWNFQFPTHSEQTLWRATSLAITVIPLIAALIDFLFVIYDINSSQGFKRTVLLALDFIMTLLLFIYVPARLSLIAQALALLRAQPSTALIAVDWTAYIPHFFS